jgi:hypothetical protein
MAVEADRRWHRKIDAYYTYRDLGNETLGRISIAREDRNRVALVMVVRVAQCLLERLRTNDLQHGAEDLVLVALEHHPGPALGVDRSPGGLRRLGDRDNLRQDCGVTVLQMGLHLPGARIVDRAGDGASARDALAVDELADSCAWGLPFSMCRRDDVCEVETGHWEQLLKQ